MSQAAAEPVPAAVGRAAHATARGGGPGHVGRRRRQSGALGPVVSGGGGAAGPGCGASERGADAGQRGEADLGGAGGRRCGGRVPVVGLFPVADAAAGCRGGCDDDDGTLPGAAAASGTAQGPSDAAPAVGRVRAGGAVLRSYPAPAAAAVRCEPHVCRGRAVCGRRAEAGAALCRGAGVCRRGAGRRAGAQALRDPQQSAEGGRCVGGMR